MSIATRNLKQTATLWTAGATDVYGNRTWSAPVPIPCRWEDVQEKVLDFQGNEIISKAIVYVDRDLSNNDYIGLGVYSDLTPPAAAKEVRNFSKIPNLAATQYVRKVIL
jgi:hypothetical protein